MKKNKGAGIIFIHDNNILLLKNKKSVWEIPGGKRDNKENLLDTARRETFEECGICPKFKLCGNYVYEDLKNKYKIYFGKIENKFDCKISNEHTSFKWCDLDKLPRLLHPKIIGALEFLKSNLLSLDNINTI